MAAKKHKYTHTHIEHHSDGSHTTHHVHEDGPKHDKKYASADHDSMLDGLLDHTGSPNPGEAEAQAGPMSAAGPAGAVAPPAAV
jgi:hypothetical protein